MRAIAVETLRPQFQPNVCLVRVHTDAGLVGVGEAYYSAEAVEAFLHHAVAPVILGSEDLGPESVSAALTPYVGYQGAGVETRAAGAVDIALWDLLGKRAGVPVVELFGGSHRASVPAYNTCAGPSYVRSTARQHTSNWGMHSTGKYEDLVAFLHHPADLTRELVAEGISGMKIWPFDTYAESTGGNDISAKDLAEGLAVVEAVRSVAPPAEMDLMIELHGLWNRPAAIKICRALEPYQPYWVEDPIRPDAISALAALRAETAVPLAVGETSVAVRGFLPLLQENCLDVVTVDAQWAGGMTVARKIASLADAFGIPVAPHDCTGPVTFAAVCHLTLSQPNSVRQETVRAFLRTWYPEIAEGLPQVVDGQIQVSEAPGLGIRLTERLEEPDVIRRITRWNRTDP